MNLRKALVAAVTVATLGIASVAQAVTVGGSAIINIYTYNAGGVASNADATVANLAGKTLTAQVLYTGLLDFFTDGANTTTVDDFLTSQGGSYSLISGNTGGLMTSGGFGTTTLFDFQAIANFDFAGTVYHDDGITMFDGGVLVTPAGSEDPTANGVSAYTMTGGNSFRLIYSAANGNPEKLLVLADDGGSIAVPLPAGGLLLLSGLGGFAAFARRRKAA